MVKQIFRQRSLQKQISWSSKLVPKVPTAKSPNSSNTKTSYRTLQVKSNAISAHDSEITGLSWCIDGARFVTSSTDKSLKIWSVALLTLECTQVFKIESSANHVEWCNLTCVYDKVDHTAPSLLMPFFIAYNTESAIKFIPGESIESSSSTNDDNMRPNCRKLPSNSLPELKYGNSGHLTSLSWLNQGNLLACSTADKIIWIWRLVAGKEVFGLKEDEVEDTTTSSSCRYENSRYSSMLHYELYTRFVMQSEELIFRVIMSPHSRPNSADPPHSRPNSADPPSNPTTTISTTTISTISTTSNSTSKCDSTTIPTSYNTIDAANTTDLDLRVSFATKERLKENEEEEEDEYEENVYRFHQSGSSKSSETPLYSLDNWNIAIAAGNKVSVVGPILPV